MEEGALVLDPEELTSQPRAEALVAEAVSLELAFGLGTAVLKVGTPEWDLAPAPRALVVGLETVDGDILLPAVSFDGEELGVLQYFPHRGCKDASRNGKVG